MLKNGEAQTLLIRYSANALMTPDRDPGIERPLMGFIDNCLKNRHNPDTVTHEAARAFVNIIIYDSNATGRKENHVFGFEITR